MKVTEALKALAARLRASAEAEPELADMYNGMALETEGLENEGESDAQDQSKAVQKGCGLVW